MMPKRFFRPDTRICGGFADGSGSAQLKYLDNNTNVGVQGVATTWPAIRDYTVQYGRFFNESEVNSMQRVVVIGSQTMSDLG